VVCRAQSGSGAWFSRGASPCGRSSFGCADEMADGARVRRYVFPRFPFSLLYRVLEGNVEIIAVAHGKRRPGYWRTRPRRAP
jgi:hypothetical protein